MEDIQETSESEYAVVQFFSDKKFSTCSRENKTPDSAAFITGNEVCIQWTKTTYAGIVVFTNGK